LKSNPAKDYRSLLQLFWEALKKFDSDHGFFLASAITFNFLICLIPLILLLLALVGTYLFSDQEVLKLVRHYLESAVPSLDPKIMENLLTIIRDRKIVGVLGMGGLIWVSTWIFYSFRTALNIVFQVEKGRSLLRGIAVDFLMVFLAGVLLLLSIALTSAIAIIQTFSPFKFLHIGPVMRFFLKYLLPFAFTFFMCFLVYKISPNKKVLSNAALQAGLFTSLLWEVAKHLFAWYVLHSTRFSMLYGSLSTLAIFFFWIYYSSAILLLGGEIACSLEKRGQRIDP
jgi:membrane protein